MLSGNGRSRIFALASFLFSPALLDVEEKYTGKKIHVEMDGSVQIAAPVKLPESFVSTDRGKEPVSMAQLWDCIGC